VAIQEFLERVSIPGFNVKKFFVSTKKPITLAIGISGGGYRAFLNGAGILAAFDDRSSNATNPGHLGGLLQGMSYIGAISGGSWALMSLVLSDFIPVEKLRNEWDMYEPLLEGVPNLKQMEVTRADIQVLPADMQDDDPDFYDRLNNQKRSWMDSQTVLLWNDDLEGYDVIDEFYKNLEFLPDFEDYGDEYEIEGDRNSGVEAHNNQEEYGKIVKRGEPIKNETVWMETFKTFFKDMLFKKKEEPKLSAHDILPNIEFPSEISLKNMKKIFTFYKNLHLEVRSKKAAGFSVSFTDYWGRALSRRVFPKSGRPPNITFSSVMNMKSFKEFQQPFPVILSNLREPGSETTSINSSVFEFTPYEFGSWDYKMFVKLKYLGSLLHGGEPLFHINNRSMCYINFDNAGFITGTSSSLFNNVLIYVWQLAASSSREKFRAIKAVLNTFGLTSTQNGIDPKKHPDYALYTPNPFYRYGDPKHVQVFNSKNLYMVDGGEDGQNVPYQPFLQPARQVDVIFSIDSTADFQGWPNGSIIQNTYLRYNATEHPAATVSIKGKIKNINIFPEIPEPTEFVAKGLHKRPTFFGCFLEKYRQRSDTLPKSCNANSYLPPIVGYFGSTEYSYQANTSTFQLTYEDTEINKIIENAYNVATYANSTIDPDYFRCVGCILLKREFDRKERGMSLLNDLEPPAFCDNCYARYCYN
jgi:putative meiotic phospholipase SPO1